MKNNWKQTLLGLVLIAAILFAVVFFLIKLSGFIENLDNKTAPAIIGGSTALLLAFFAFWREVRKSRKEAHREKKIEVYKIFSNLIFSLIRGVNEGNDTSEFVTSNNFKDKMWDLKEGILFYGSPKVIKSFNSWMKSQDADNEHLKDQKDSLRSVGEVLLAMRADLGLSNFGLDSLSIHQIYTTGDLEG